MGREGLNQKDNTWEHLLWWNRTGGPSGALGLGFDPSLAQWVKDLCCQSCGSDLIPGLGGAPYALGWPKKNQP